MSRHIIISDEGMCLCGNYNGVNIGCAGVIAAMDDIDARKMIFDHPAKPTEAEMLFSRVLRPLIEQRRENE